MTEGTLVTKRKCPYSREEQRSLISAQCLGQYFHHAARLSGVSILPPTDWPVTALLADFVDINLSEEKENNFDNVLSFSTHHTDLCSALEKFD